MRQQEVVQSQLARMMTQRAAERDVGADAPEPGAVGARCRKACWRRSAAAARPAPKPTATPTTKPTRAPTLTTAIGNARRACRSSILVNRAFVMPHADLFHRLRNCAARQDRRSRRCRRRAAALPACARSRRAGVHAAVFEHRQLSRCRAAPSTGAQDVPLAAGPASLCVSRCSKRDCRIRPCRCIWSIVPRLTTALRSTHRTRRASALPDPATCGARRLPAAGVAPHIVHCNDWHTALVPLLLQEPCTRGISLFAATRAR